MAIHNIKMTYHFHPGQRFGKLTLRQRTKINYKDSPTIRVKWVCDCDCGVRCTVAQFYLVRDGNPRTDCGCGKKSNKTYFNQEYRIWLMMLKRTTDPTHVSYKDYGGRGIKVCAEWSDKEIGFDKFLAYIGPRPSPSHTVDRIDNDMGYQPFQADGTTRQVKWSTPTEQRANQRKPSSTAPLIQSVSTVKV